MGGTGLRSEGAPRRDRVAIKYRSSSTEYLCEKVSTSECIAASPAEDEQPRDADDERPGAQLCGGQSRGCRRADAVVYAEHLAESDCLRIRVRRSCAFHRLNQRQPVTCQDYENF